MPQAHLAIVRDILTRSGVALDRVALFGSRATGRARPDSDIDLVLYGQVPEATLALLHQRFEDSLLPVTVDLLVYDRIEHGALKAHVDRAGRRLFAHAQIGQGTDHD
jgi:predicted nucleotidyltransferase